MKEAVAVHPVRHPRYRFRVTFRETQADGTSIRRKSYFTTKREADEFARTRRVEIGNHGARHASVEDDERAALIRFREWSSRRGDAPSLSALLERAIAAHEAARPPCTVSQAIDARLHAADRRGLSDRHQADLRSRLERWRGKHGARQIADISAREVEAWLHRLSVSPVTWGNYARSIHSVFTLAVKSGYLPANPLTSLDKPKTVAKGPAILTPSQLSALLLAAAPELVPLLVLQAFCGVRRAEAGRMTWGNVRLDEENPWIEIPGSATKTNRRRSHEITPCAVAWLRPLAGHPATVLGLTETVYRRRLRDAARAAGIEWDENLLRHSFGTYRLAVLRNAAAVAEEMGNSPAIVRTHYQNVASPADAAAWWQILPAGAGTNTIPMPRQRAAG